MSDTSLHNTVDCSRNIGLWEKLPVLMATASGLRVLCVHKRIPFAGPRSGLSLGTMKSYLDAGYVWGADTNERPWSGCFREVTGVEWPIGKQGKIRVATSRV